MLACSSTLVATFLSRLRASARSSLTRRHASLRALPRKGFEEESPRRDVDLLPADEADEAGESERRSASSSAWTSRRREPASL
jgi:hypothetical protein